jgi:hypothetical protein
MRLEAWAQSTEIPLRKKRIAVFAKNLQKTSNGQSIVKADFGIFEQVTYQSQQTEGLKLAS